MEIWKPSRVELNASGHWRLGLVDIWLERARGEWRAAFKRVPQTYDARTDQDEKLSGSDPVVAARDPKPDDVAWRRMLFEGDSTEFRLLPLMPDRPVVVRPEAPLLIPPKREATVYVSIPLWVRIVVGADGSLVLGEEPTVILSNIWFGDVTAGELCYSVSTRARLAASAEHARPHRAICPVHIRNGHTRNLEFQRLCVHVEALDLFQGSDQLWANRLNVEYFGEEKPARTKAESGPPKDEPAGELLTGARKPAQKGIFSKAFGGIGM